MLTSDGALNPPNSKKVLWGVVQSVMAVGLLIAGGLKPPAGDLHRRSLSLHLHHGCHLRGSGEGFEGRKSIIPLKIPM